MRRLTLLQLAALLSACAAPPPAPTIPTPVPVPKPPLKIALVLGAEGKGLRQKTRETCTTLARIDLPGEIRSLNVSNAAVLSLYIARRHVDGAR